MGEFGSAHCGTNEGKKKILERKGLRKKKNSFVRFEVLRGKKKKKRRRRRAVCGMFWTEVLRGKKKKESCGMFWSEVLVW